MQDQRIAALLHGVWWHRQPLWRPYLFTLWNNSFCKESRNPLLFVFTSYTRVEASWNVMAHAQKPDFVFRRNGRVHLNRPGGRQFSRLLAAELCASAVVMLDTPCSEVVWRLLATHSVCQFPLQLPFRASPCAITFQLESTPYCSQPDYSASCAPSNDSSICGQFCCKIRKESKPFSSP